MSTSRTDHSSIDTAAAKIADVEIRDTHARLVRGRLVREEERGATLILALLFLVVVSLIVMSIATWTEAGLQNTNRFKAAQSTVSMANSVTELAVQYQRYNFTPSTLNASPPAPCWPGSTSSSLTLANDPSTVSVWCSMLWFYGSTARTRVVTFSACLSTLSNAACAATPLLQAVVYYDDYKSSGGANTCTSLTSAGTCGQEMEVHSWVFVPTPPAVSVVTVGNVYTPTCPTTFPLTISGSGFASPSQVYFIFAGTSNTAAYPAAGQPVVVDSGHITTCEPSSPAGLLTGTATVVVMTPTGMSPEQTSPPGLNQVQWP